MDHCGVLPTLALHNDSLNECASLHVTVSVKEGRKLALNAQTIVMVMSGRTVSVNVHCSCGDVSNMLHCCM